MNLRGSFSGEKCSCWLSSSASSSSVESSTRLDSAPFIRNSAATVRQLYGSSRCTTAASGPFWLAADLGAVGGRGQWKRWKSARGKGKRRGEERRGLLKCVRALSLRRRRKWKSSPWRLFLLCSRGPQDRLVLLFFSVLYRSSTDSAMASSAMMSRWCACRMPVFLPAALNLSLFGVSLVWQSSRTHLFLLLAFLHCSAFFPSTWTFFACTEQSWVLLDWFSECKSCRSRTRARMAPIWSMELELNWTAAAF